MPFPNQPTQFQPGRSGNPKGRPPSKSITDRLREALEKSDDEGRIVADRIVAKWLERVLAGDVGALKELLNRLEGRAPHRAGGPDDAPLTVVVEYVDDWRTVPSIGDGTGVLGSLGFDADRPSSRPGAGSSVIGLDDQPAGLPDAPAGG
jgi:hypothetical protein